LPGLFFLWILACNTLQSQSSYLPYFHEAYDFADRLAHIYRPDSTYHYSVRKIHLGEGETSFKSYQKLNMSKMDSTLLQYYLFDFGFADEYFPERSGFFNIFYKNPAHFYEYKSKSFEILVNTISDFRGGHEASDGRFIFLNSRGLDFWGKLDNRFYFYASIFENQSNFLNYIENFVEEKKAIPGYGHFRSYESSTISALRGYDYANSRAYLGYKVSEHTELELGHGNHFIGNGIRSLLLSDFSHNYFYLRFAVKVWKLNYQSIVAELSPISSIQTFGNTVLPKKYFATHYLSMKLSPRFELGLFESVVFSRQDQFEFQYLNPVILYRTVEALFDSPDNLLLGFNMNWFAGKKSSFYTQLLLDELRSSEIFAGKGWWGNKWAYQLGFKTFDLFTVNNLDLRMEYNRVRPFTYSHNVGLDDFPQQSATSYSHFNQALAHPLGSNFSEFIVRLKYKPIPVLTTRLQYFYAKQGRNIDGINYGSDILVNNSTRNDDFNINQFQGAETEINNLDLQFSFKMLYDFYLDLYIRIRKENNESLGKVNTNYWGLGIRYNVENINIDY